jgi:hypothetical protein
MSSDTASATDRVSEPAQKPFFRRALKFIAICGLGFVALIAILILYNNYALRSPSRAEFTAQLDQKIELSTKWMSEHPDILGNPPLLFVIGDMASMSHDPRLERMVSEYLHSKYAKREQRITSYYARMADGVTEVPPLSIFDTADVLWQNRVDAFCVAPQKVDLPVQEKADLFNPNRYTWGARVHQLIALDICRHFNGPSYQLDAVINPVAEAVARDARWDFRVTDTYPQHIWTVLDAGRPDLVRKQWVLRLMAHQRPDGSFPYCWYGWCRGVFEFRLTDPDPEHVTTQGAYALYLIKYRYPQWIDEHFK